MTLVGRSNRRRGSANSRLCVNSRRMRVVRAWFMPPRTTVRALLKNPGISVCTCRIAHSCNTSSRSWPSVTGTAVVAVRTRSSSARSPSNSPEACASRIPVTAMASAVSAHCRTSCSADRTSPPVPDRTRWKSWSRKVTCSS